MLTATRTKITPPQLARQWGVSPETIIAWIRSGELRAVNAAVRVGGRPRYLIDQADVVIFEARRAVVAPTKSPRRRPRIATGVIEFF